ncbi:MAG: TrmH family RNA methyltransferase, partial [Mycobacteriales bacterium]
PRIAAARKLTRRDGRDAADAFLAEGPQAVREAIACAPADVRELFVAAAVADRQADLIVAAADAGIRVTVATERAVAGLAETTHPQGIVAACARPDPPLAGAIAAARLVAVLVAPRDPGNAGTVLRCADAAGADAVILTGDAVDAYNGKCVRAAAGSHFHLPVVRTPDPVAAIGALRRSGLQILAADAAAEADLDELADDGSLAAPTAWLFGNEAWGIPGPVAAAADRRVRVPIHGRAESLNLAAAAAVCLYASARAQRAGARKTRSGATAPAP